MEASKKVFVIVYRPGKEGLDFLCLKPNPEPNRNTDYYVITGGVDNSESNVEAALREVKEEIGVKTREAIDLHNQIEYMDHITHKHYVEHCFAVKINNENLVLNEEHIDYIWVNADKFIQTIWWNENKRSELERMIKQIQKYEI